MLPSFTSGCRELVHPGVKEGNMGMLLADLINGLGLGTHEQVQVLGQELFEELKDFLKSPVQN